MLSMQSNTAHVFSLRSAYSFCTDTSSSFGLGRLLHANIFRTNSVYVATVLLAAVVGTGLYDSAFQFAWEANNKGVSGTEQTHAKDARVCDGRGLESAMALSLTRNLVASTFFCFCFSFCRSCTRT